MIFVRLCEMALFSTLLHHIQSFFASRVPYTKALRVKVVQRRVEEQGGSQTLHLALADATGCIKATCYNENQSQRLEVS